MTMIAHHDCSEGNSLITGPHPRVTIMAHWVFHESRCIKFARIRQSGLECWKAFPRTHSKGHMAVPGIVVRNHICC
jgi:hypothetical protein